MIRLMTPSDLAFADTLRAMVGWNQRLPDWRRLLRYEPEGCFVAEREGQPIGTATTTRFETQLAWIGMVLVHPDHRRRGVATALMNHCLDYLKQKGVGCVKLDATPNGQLVYERLGFKAECTLTRWECPSPSSRRTSSTVQFHTPATSALMGPLDEQAFGVNRLRLLEMLRQDSERVLLHPELPACNAYGMIRAGARAAYLGPVVARTEMLAWQLIPELLLASPNTRVYWDIPDCQTGTIALAQELGFSKQRPLVRMYQGETNVAGQPERVFAISGPATG